VERPLPDRRPVERQAVRHSETARQVIPLMYYNKSIFAKLHLKGADDLGAVPGRLRQDQGQR